MRIAVIFSTLFTSVRVGTYSGFLSRVIAAAMWSRTGAVICLSGMKTLLGVIDTCTPCTFLMMGGFTNPVSIPGRALIFLTRELSA